jgi:hypothetical protein
MMTVTQMFRCPNGRRFANGIRQHPHQALRNATQSIPWSIDPLFDYRVGTCHKLAEPRSLARTCCAEPAIGPVVIAHAVGRNLNEKLVGRRFSRMLKAIVS